MDGKAPVYLLPHRVDVVLRESTLHVKRLACSQSQALRTPISERTKLARKCGLNKTNCVSCKLLALGYFFAQSILQMRPWTCLVNDYSPRSARIRSESPRREFRRQW